MWFLNNYSDDDIWALSKEEALKPRADSEGVEQPSMLRQLESLCYGNLPPATDDEIAQSFDYIAGAFGYPDFIEYHELFTFIAKGCANLDL